MLDTTSVAAGGGPVVATITVSGATQAVVTETLPAGFTYVSSSLPDSQVRPDPNDGQRIRFVLADSADNPFTYTVTVSQAGAISGKLTVDRVEYDVTGDNMVTVEGTTGPSAGRVFDTRSVAAGGGPVVATITVSGATQAVVTETLPAGFTYVSSSLPDSQVRPDPNDGQRIRFVLADSADNPFTYRVTVSQAGAISGKLTVDRVEYDVTGNARVTVGASASARPGGEWWWWWRWPLASSGGGGLRPWSRRWWTVGRPYVYTNTSTDVYAHACAHATPRLTGHGRRLRPRPRRPRRPRQRRGLRPRRRRLPRPRRRRPRRPRLRRLQACATATTAPTATATTAPAPTATTAPTATPTTAPAPTATTAPTATPTVGPSVTEEEGGGLPVWVSIVLIIGALGLVVVGGLFFFRSRTR